MQNTFPPTNQLPVSVEFHGDHKTLKAEMNLVTISFGDITGFKIVVSVCLSCY